MPLLDSLLGPITGIIDRIIPDKDARDRAKLELIRLQGTQEMELLQTRLSAIVAEAGSSDPWTSRARPSFLYVMYALILWAVPMGVIGAFSPRVAGDIAASMTAARTALRALRYGLSRLLGDAPVGQNRGFRQVATVKRRPRDAVKKR